MCLLNGLTKAATGEMHLTAEALGVVVTKPVLKEGGAMGVISTCYHYLGNGNALLEGTGAEGIEAEALAGVDDGQLASHGQNGTLAGSVSQLRSGSTHQSDKASSVDHAASLLVVATHAQHSVLATEPHALDVDRLRQVPDLLLGVDRVVVAGRRYQPPGLVYASPADSRPVHDPSIVELPKISDPSFRHLIRS